MGCQGKGWETIGAGRRMGMTELGEKKKQQEVEGALGAPKGPVVWSSGKTPAHALGLPWGPREGMGWVLVPKGRTSPLCSVPVESASPAPRAALGEHPCPTVQWQPPALGTPDPLKCKGQPLPLG